MYVQVYKKKKSPTHTDSGSQPCAPPRQQSAKINCNKNRRKVESTQREGKKLNKILRINNE